MNHDASEPGDPICGPPVETGMSTNDASLRAEGAVAHRDLVVQGGDKVTRILARWVRLSRGAYWQPRRVDGLSHDRRPRRMRRPIQLGPYSVTTEGRRRHRRHPGDTGQLYQRIGSISQAVYGSPVSTGRVD
jgi:hypothetical protein